MLCNYIITLGYMFHIWKYPILMHIIWLNELKLCTVSLIDEECTVLHTKHNIIYYYIYKGNQLEFWIIFTLDTGNA